MTKRTAGAAFSYIVTGRQRIRANRPLMLGFTGAAAAVIAGST